MPDIDFNIRTGNTLVGYVSYDDVERAATSKFDFDDALDKISATAADLQDVFDVFRARQVEGDGSVPREEKKQLHKSLKTLAAELNVYLSGEYGVKAAKTDVYGKWLKSHQPFHWFVEFYSIMCGGGFDVIIGNPPYLELKALNSYGLRGFECAQSGNLYALVIERGDALGREGGRQGYIVPVSSVSAKRYTTLQHLLTRREDYFSSYDDRPSRLFDGLEHIRLTIHILGRQVDSSTMFSTRYNKWKSEERPDLFPKLRFTGATTALVEGSLPKFCNDLEKSIATKLASQCTTLAKFYSRSGASRIFYSRKVGYFLQVLDFEPRVLDGQGQRRPPSELKKLRFASVEHAQLALCCLNASLFYWFVTVFSDCRHLNKREVDALPIDLEALSNSASKRLLLQLGGALMADLQKNSQNSEMHYGHDTLTIQCIYPSASKLIIDKIDILLSQHYGFTEEELDFIINYDIKYRMGVDTEGDEE